MQTACRFTQVPSFVHKSLADSKISKPVKLFFLLLLFTLSLDFGFAVPKSRAIRVSVNVMLLLMVLTISIAGIDVLFDIYNNNSNNVFFVVSFSVVIFHYICVILIFKTKSVLTVHNYFKTLCIVDVELKTSRLFNVDSCGVISIAAYLIVKAAVWCWSSTQITYAISFHKKIVLFIPFMSFDAVVLVHILVLLAVRRRLRDLANYMENNDVNILRCQYIYKYLSDRFRDVKKVFDSFFGVAVFTIIPLMMYAIWYILLVGIKSKELDSGTKWDRNFIFLKLFLIFMPPCAGTMLSNAATEVRSALQHILLKGNQEQSSHDIDLFIWYTRARPFKYTVFKIIPMTTSFPVNIISILVTYLIVIAQFVGY